jgi:hypothetical protein
MDHVAILNIYVLRAFKRCKEVFNSMCFHLLNYFLKIWVSIKDLIPIMGVHLGVCTFILPHFLALLGM